MQHESIPENVVNPSRLWYTEGPTTNDCIIDEVTDVCGYCFWKVYPQSQ
jgi:hypothetical protein